MDKEVRRIRRLRADRVWEALETHPAYLLAMHHATAAADIISSEEDDNKHDFCMGAHAVGKILREKAAEAEQRLIDEGFVFDNEGSIVVWPERILREAGGSDA